MEHKITKRVVDGLKPEVVDVFIWDQEVSGFGLRVKPSGVKSYLLRYRKDGRRYQVTIGQHGSPWNPETARRQAQLLLAQVIEGRNPAMERGDARIAPTIEKLAERYLTEHSAVKNKKRSHESNQRILKSFVLPELGHFKVAAVSREDIARIHHELRKTPTQANRVLALLSKLFNLAERWSMRPDGSNPCRHVERFKENKRNRFLTPEEFGRFDAALTRAEDEKRHSPAVVGAIRLLALTGARLNEILCLRWSHVDFTHRVLRLEDSKTGPKVIPLNAQALAILNALNGRLSPWVIPGQRRGKHLINLEKPWRAIRKDAGLDDLRLHDLRHSFASMAAAEGMSLPKIGALLGHSQPSTTQRYAHLGAHPLQEASDLIGTRITEAMHQKKVSSS